MVQNSFIQQIKTDRKTQAIVGLVFVTLIVLIVIVILFVQSNKSSTSSDDGSVAFQNQDGYFRKLDGTVVDSAGQVDSYPVAVMIENLKSVRPQSGLSRAGVIYEALTEGGITRFLAVYGNNSIEKIGPVRSVRPYFVDIASEYSALYAHAGGSPEALQKIPNSSVVDLNQIGGDQAYFWRDNALDAPHNLFTKSEYLTFALRDKKVLNEKSLFEGWKFIDDIASSQRKENNTQIIIPFSNSDYEVEYDYDVEKNVYFRSNGGKPHVDELTGERLQPKNVIVQFVDKPDVDADGRLSIALVGEGKMILFSNGSVTEGVWKKEGEDLRTRYYNDKNEEVSLVRGQTWIEIISKDREITY